MNNGTPIDVEAQLNMIIEDLYRGLYDLARKVRGGESKDDIADELEELAGDICNHWPTCAAEHQDRSRAQRG